MGMYDEVQIMCPECKRYNFVQTKSGGCNLKIYGQDEVPVDVAGGLIESQQYCEHCGVLYVIKQRIPVGVSLKAEVIF